MPVLTVEEVQLGVRYRVRNKAALRVGASMDSARAYAPPSLQPGDWYTVDRIERVVGRRGAPVTRLRCAAGRGWISLCSGQGAPLLEYTFRQVEPHITPSTNDVAALTASGGDSGKAPGTPSTNNVAGLTASGGDSGKAPGKNSVEEAESGLQCGAANCGVSETVTAVECTAGMNIAAREAGDGGIRQSSDSSSEDDGQGSGDGQDEDLHDSSCIGAFLRSVAMCGFLVCLACTFAPLFVRGARPGLSERWNQPQQCKVGLGTPGGALPSIAESLARRVLLWL
eukprot:COSAG01_NODE_1479_length_10161_cov_138.934109_7_plen_283_part_00